MEIVKLLTVISLQYFEFSNTYTIAQTISKTFLFYLLKFNSLLKWLSLFFSKICFSQLPNSCKIFAKYLTFSSRKFSFGKIHQISTCSMVIFQMDYWVNFEKCILSNFLLFLINGLEILGFDDGWSRLKIVWLFIVW